MTLRLALPAADRLLESITVKRAAEILCCDDSTVRALLRGGSLEGHKIGKTENPGGVRVDLQSVKDYKARHAIVPVNASRAAPRKRPSTAAHREALAYLISIGVQV